MTTTLLSQLCYLRTRLLSLSSLRPHYVMPERCAQAGSPQVTATGNTAQVA